MYWNTEMREREKDPCLHGAYILTRKTDINIYNKCINHIVCWMLKRVIKNGEERSSRLPGEGSLFEKGRSARFLSV